MNNETQSAADGMADGLERLLQALNDGTIQVYRWGAEGDGIFVYAKTKLLTYRVEQGIDLNSAAWNWAESNMTPEQD